MSEPQFEDIWAERCHCGHLRADHGRWNAAMDNLDWTGPCNHVIDGFPGDLTAEECGRPYRDYCQCAKFNRDKQEECRECSRREPA